MIKRAFTLVEVLIVVAILGILAAIVIPHFQSQSQDAKEAAAKDNLRILRNAIEIYSSQHNDTPPGYDINGNITASFYFEAQLTAYTNSQGLASETKSENFRYGPYLSDLPVNPFNQKSYFWIFDDATPLPDNASGSFGWIYKPATRTVKLDAAGTDSEGTPYYDY